MALTESQKDEINELIDARIADLVSEHGTYGEVRAAFKEEAKAQRKAERDAAKAAEAEKSKPAESPPVRRV